MATPAVMLIVFATWWYFTPMRHEPVTLPLQLHAIMGTEGRVVVQVPRGRIDEELHELRAVESEIRRIEARMSTWIDDSEMSRLNHAAAGVHVPLSDESLAVLRAAHAAWTQTDGAFDVTCRPVIELWREAARTGRLPDDKAIAAARAESSWPQIELLTDGARKTVATARVDLGGIAKGFAIDEGIDYTTGNFARSGVHLTAGGLVEIGGDLAVSGRAPGDKPWRVDVRDPFGTGTLGALEISAVREGRAVPLAVCTSGNYARFSQIEGRRYSHIIDPRTGRPAEGVPSVTVLAPTAMTADIWATALSVLGPEGLNLMNQHAPEAEAMLIVGTVEEHSYICTDGFLAYVDQALKTRIGAL